MEITRLENTKIMSANDLKMIELSQTIKTWSEALRTSIRISDICDKQVQIELDMDKGNFSRVLSGDANLSGEKIIKFCNIVGHQLPLHWLAYQAGYELKVIPKTLEDIIETKDKELRKMREKLTYMEGLIMMKSSKSADSSPPI